MEAGAKPASSKAVNRQREVQARVREHSAAMVGKGAVVGCWKSRDRLWLGVPVVVDAPVDLHFHRSRGSYSTPVSVQLLGHNFRSL